MTKTLTHLERLEAEAIHIMREVVAEADKPVMLYSVGKDSAVMLHLARNAYIALNFQVVSICNNGKGGGDG